METNEGMSAAGEVIVANESGITDLPGTPEDAEDPMQVSKEPGPIVAAETDKSRSRRAPVHSVQAQVKILNIWNIDTVAETFNVEMRITCFDEFGRRSFHIGRRKSYRLSLIHI